MNKLTKVKAMSPMVVERKVDDLLVFDARFVDTDMRRELLRLLPQLIHMRYAWRAHFRRYGCFACPKTDPTIAIAARLRRRGSTWAEIYEIIGVDRAATTRAERKLFEYPVRRKLALLDDPPRGRSWDTTASPLRGHTYHYGGGICDKCYRRIRRRLSKILRKRHEGHNPAELATFKEALTLKHSAAQRLLNGGEE